MALAFAERARELVLVSQASDSLTVPRVSKARVAAVAAQVLSAPVVLVVSVLLATVISLA